MKLRIIFPVIALAIVIILIIATIGYPYKARLFPLLIAIPLAALLVIDFLKEAYVKLKQESDSIGRKNISKDAIIKGIEVSAWIVGFSLIVYLLGFLIGVPLFLLFYFKLHGEKWLTSIIYCSVVTISMWGIFIVIFEMHLYNGIFME